MKAVAVVVGGACAAYLLYRRSLLAYVHGDERAEGHDEAYAAKPVIIFCSRTVKSADASKYTETFAKFAAEAQGGDYGVRACFSFIDRDKPDTVVQFLWFDTPEGCVKLMKESKPWCDLTDYYSGSAETDIQQFWTGSVTDELKAAAAKVPNVKAGFGSSIRGFIRPPSSPGFKAGAPVIWVSKRKIKDGKMADNIKYWGILSEMQYVNAPGCVATIEVTADDAPDYLWSCRIFTDFDTGFVAHFPMTSPSVLYHGLRYVLPTFDSEPWPYSYSFSTPEWMEKIVRYNDGNKAFNQYHWAKGLIGPMPDFAK